MINRLYALLYRMLLILFIGALTACGGGGGGGNNITLVDTVAPERPGLSLLEITAQTHKNYSFRVFSAEIDTTYHYQFIDKDQKTIAGNGNVSARDFTIDAIDLSSLSDGVINFEFYLTDAANNQSTPAQLTLNKASALPSQVSLSGKILFDFVPHDTASNGLDYRATFSKPARGVQVLLLNKNDVELDSTITNSSGEYLFTITPQTDIKIRAQAKLFSDSSASWDFAVTDNTNNNALYVLQSRLINTGVSNSVHNLRADSGWGGSAYTETRAAAPFAILDTIYSAIQLVLDTDANAQFPAAELRWSTRNNTSSGNIDEGDIGTSFYSSSDGNMYILGAENNDTDEYDQHIIAHEFGHYFEHRFSRLDSQGGSHTEGDHLDMRVAFSEGLGNALSAMITNDPIYRDSLGNDQSLGFSIDIEDNNNINSGWYSEASVHSILYDIFDANNDGNDFIFEGFDPIYHVLTSSHYKNASPFSSIHLFLSELKAALDDTRRAQQIDDIAQGQNITVNNAFAEGELNDAGDVRVLPVYHTITAGGSLVEVCSLNGFGSANKLANTAFLKLKTRTLTSHTISVTRRSGLNNSDPDINLWLAGVRKNVASSIVVDNESLTHDFIPGTYIIEVMAYGNIAGGNSSGDVCFDVEVN